MSVLLLAKLAKASFLGDRGANLLLTMGSIGFVITWDLFWPLVLSEMSRVLLFTCDAWCLTPSYCGRKYSPELRLKWLEFVEFLPEPERISRTRDKGTFCLNECTSRDWLNSDRPPPTVFVPSRVG